MTRRQVLIGVGTAALGSLAVGLLWKGLTGPQWVKAASVTTIAAEDVVYVPEAKAFVVEAGDGPEALSIWVPHEARDFVRFCPSSRLFESTRLNAKFDRRGVYFSGPGKRGLARLATKIEDGVVYVNPDKVSPGPARKQVEPLEPVGPFCVPSSSASIADRPGFFEVTAHN